MSSTDSHSGDSSVILPERVRKRVIELVSSLLPALSREEVPSGVTPFLRFTPNRRARAASHHIAVALASEESFRERIAEEARKAAGDVVKALNTGSALDTLDPVEVAAFAYITRVENWEEYVERVPQQTEQKREKPTVDVSKALAEVQKEFKQERRALRAEITELRKERDALRAQLRSTEAQQRSHSHDIATYQKHLEAVQQEMKQRGRESDAALRQSRAETREVRDALAAAQRASHAGAEAHTGRVSVLLRTLAATADGLRSELGVDERSDEPADVVARKYSRERTESTPHRDDVQRLDERLALPGAHLIVDGYNVTKTGYPEISLERQRQRLLTTLSALASQTGAEITVVFDGTYRVHAVPSPRGVRSVFSQGSQIADEVIREIVAAEPHGRAVTVITSDRAVVRSVQSETTHALASTVLLERLSRV